VIREQALSLEDLTHTLRRQIDPDPPVRGVKLVDQVEAASNCPTTTSPTISA
jgi:hypothetical protein